MGKLVDISEHDKTISDWSVDDFAIISKINKKFTTLENLITTKFEKKHGLIIKGPPGIGKTHTVRKMLPLNAHIQTSKGGLSAFMLYCHLYAGRAKDAILILDDCDNALKDHEVVALLKAAIDTDDQRLVTWNKASYALDEANIPKEFSYQGRIIILTNLDLTMKNSRSKNLQQQHIALESRSFSLNLDINSRYEMYLRCRWVMEKSDIAPTEQHDEILNYLITHKDNLKEMSLRTVESISELMDKFPGDWEDYAEQVLLRA